MQLHQIKPKIKSRPKNRVGRGGKRGTFSGKGSKGQKSRVGHRIKPQLRDIIKRLPKKRGYRFKSIRPITVVVNLNIIEKKFKDNESVTPKILRNKGLIRVNKGKWPMIKILGDGELTKKIVVSGCEVSLSAKEKIEKAGGSVKADVEEQPKVSKN